MTAKMNKFHGYANTSSQAFFDAHSCTDFEGAGSFVTSELV